MVPIPPTSKTPTSRARASNSLDTGRSILSIRHPHPSSRSSNLTTLLKDIPSTLEPTTGRHYLEADTAANIISSLQRLSLVRIRMAKSSMRRIQVMPHRERTAQVFKAAFRTVNQFLSRRHLSPHRRPLELQRLVPMGHNLKPTIALIMGHKRYGRVPVVRAGPSNVKHVILSRSTDALAIECQRATIGFHITSA